GSPEREVRHNSSGTGAVSDRGVPPAPRCLDSGFRWNDEDWHHHREDRQNGECRQNGERHPVNHSRAYPSFRRKPESTA
ncbi:MAG TPA: hypothetical protein VMT78_12465, partial [Terriglobia bacterium]|nr:hypothetical protein [Terriglobia bacterium]